MHQFLKWQLLDYRIFVIEQVRLLGNRCANKTGLQKPKRTGKKNKQIYIYIYIYIPALSEIKFHLELYFAFDARRTQPKMHTEAWGQPLLTKKLSFCFLGQLNGNTV